MFKQIIFSLLLSTLIHVMTGCRGDILLPPPEHTAVTGGQDGPVAGFYLLNEGNMGSNRAEIDYFNLHQGTFIRNIYTAMNPDAVKELGDVGNDLLIAHGQLYATINCSHKVEVMQASDGRRIGQIDIPNCRFLAADEHHLYVSSYVGPVQPDPHAPRGAVFRIDPVTLQIDGIAQTGYQPEQMAIAQGKLYVANSGGYRAPDYDNTLTVIDLESFTVTGSIYVAPNLYGIIYDEARHQLLVSSQGNDTDIQSDVYTVSVPDGSVTGSLDIRCNRMALHDDCLYIISREPGSKKTSFIKYDLETETRKGSFITAPSPDMTTPYCLAINPYNGDIYVGDARNYVSSGRLHCFSSSGEYRWTVTTGDIPSSIAFYIL
ncbi:MAG: YncE family protein [Muribaculaceae bacterium]|nr:YncE family protein [Muribaculaceae bacterium]